MVPPQRAWRLTFSGHAVPRAVYQCPRYGYDRRDPFGQGTRHGARTTICDNSALAEPFTMANVVATVVRRSCPAAVKKGIVQESDAYALV
jgi:hypothetical protein